MNKLNDSIIKFKQLLNSTWTIINNISASDKTNSFKADWLQVNWELIVEGSLQSGIYLEVYGEGADCNNDSSRVLYPEKKATHKVVCYPKNLNYIEDLLEEVKISIRKDEIVFDSLVTVVNDWYFEQPPFNGVLCEYNSRFIVISLNETEFDLLRCY